MVLARVSPVSLKLKVSKCFFVLGKANILGHVEDANVARIDVKNVQAIQDIYRPRSTA